MKFFVVISLLLVSLRLSAATNFVGSLDRSTVAAAITAASDGDVLILPTGTNTWTANLAVAKNITLQGTGSDQTVIIDEIPRSTTASILTATLHDNAVLFRLTGITFRRGVTNAVVNFNGAISVGGVSKTFRIDNCNFDQLYATAILVRGWVYGVIDHNNFNLPFKQGVVVWHNSYSGASYGDGAWADLPYFGTDKFLFIENNVFTETTANTPGAIDVLFGGRSVIRFNTFNNTHPTNHGTDSGGRNRSARAIEIYNNMLSAIQLQSGGQFRGGTGLVFSNIYTGTWSGGMSLTVYREFQSFSPWGAATGTNAWDSNDPVLHLTGAHSGTNGSPVLVVSGANWTNNQWVGFILNNITSSKLGFIQSNTSNTIAFFRDSSFSTPMSFNTGDSFSIRKVLIALDQPGRGKGVLLSNSPALPLAWPAQALEPIYAWSNLVNGANSRIGSSYPTLTAGVDYFNDTPMPGYTPFTYPHPLVTDFVMIPAAPSALGASTISSSQINLSWTDNSTNELGFKIERSTATGGGFVQVATASANATSFSDAPLLASTTYYYRVKAFNSGGDSAYSNTANATTSGGGGSHGHGPKPRLRFFNGL